MGTFFDLSVKHPNRHQQDDQNQKRNKGAQNTPQQLVVPLGAGNDTAGNSSYEGNDQISVHSLLFFPDIPHANERYGAASGYLGKDTVPFFDGLNVGFYFSELYQVD